MNGNYEWFVLLLAESSSIISVRLNDISKNKLLQLFMNFLHCEVVLSSRVSE